SSFAVETCKRNSCPLCPCSLDSVWELKDHLARRHDMKVHKCAFCGAKFREIEQMAVHVKKRHGEKLMQQIQQSAAAA
ncbi:Zinc finger C2H2-type, partial [Trinorchestia longiramus]